MNISSAAQGEEAGSQLIPQSQGKYRMLVWPGGRLRCVLSAPAWQSQGSLLGHAVLSATGRESSNIIGLPRETDLLKASLSYDNTAGLVPSLQALPP